MSHSETVILKWKRYTSYKDVRLDDDAWSQGVYLMADNKGIPLYIGMTNGKWGFADRYNATGFLDAAIRSCGNLIFFAKVEPRSLCKEVETQLLWQERPRFNEKIRTARTTIDIKHEGKVPSFSFTTEKRARESAEQKNTEMVTSPKS
jgi:hypothetical protein